MKRFFAVFVLLCAVCAADVVSDKIRALVEAQTYSVNQGLIEVVFKNRTEFMSGGTADCVKIAAKLKEYGLLDIFYKDGPHRLTATFRSTKDQFFFLKAIGESLDRLGYKYTPISAMRSDALYFEWTLSYKSDHAIDPAALAKELVKFNVTIDDIAKQGDNWTYLISSKKPIVPDAALLTTEHTAANLLTTKNVFGEYWVRLPDSGNRVGIKRATGGAWSVYVVFYDAGLRPIQTATSVNPVREFRSPIPEGAAYLKITDNDIAATLQRGVDIWLE